MAEEQLCILVVGWKRGSASVKITDAQLNKMHVGSRDIVVSMTKSFALYAVHINAKAAKVS